ncbi:MAG: hypothetical protein K9L64_05090 [Candidatus Izimaplasma sp.]|nr:hypothetical protein [Candidatus Izimaplasma bacterium]
MENLIRDIIEFDKKKRLEVEELEKEKKKIGAYLREKRKEIEKRYKAEADEIFAKRKTEIEKTISEAEEKAQDKYKISLKEIEITFNKHRQEWIDSLYDFCTSIEKEGE